MKRYVVLFTHTMDFGGGPESGSWYERGHFETKFIEKLAEEKKMRPLDAYHVLLTNKEYNELLEKAEPKEVK